MPAAAEFEVYRDGADEWRWRRRARRGDAAHEREHDREVVQEARRAVPQREGVAVPADPDDAVELLGKVGRKRREQQGEHGGGHVEHLPGGPLHLSDEDAGAADDPERQRRLRDHDDPVGLCARRADEPGGPIDHLSEVERIEIVALHEPARSQRPADVGDREDDEEAPMASERDSRGTSAPPDQTGSSMSMSTPSSSSVSGSGGS